MSLSGFVFGYMLFCLNLQAHWNRQYVQFKSPSRTDTKWHNYQTVIIDLTFWNWFSRKEKPDEFFELSKLSLKKTIFLRANVFHSKRRYINDLTYRGHWIWRNNRLCHYFLTLQFKYIAQASDTSIFCTLPYSKHQNLMNWSRYHIISQISFVIPGNILELFEPLSTVLQASQCTLLPGVFFGSCGLSSWITVVNDM